MEIEEMLRQRVFTRRQFREIPASIRRLFAVEQKRIGRLTVYIVRGVLPEPPPRPPRRRRGKIAKLAEVCERLLRERGCIRVGEVEAPRASVYLAIKRIRERLGLVYIRPYWCMPGRLPPVSTQNRVVAPTAVLKEAARLCRSRFKLTHLMRRLQFPAAAAPMLASLLRAAGFKRDGQWYLCPETPSFSAPGRRLREKGSGVEPQNLES